MVGSICFALHEGLTESATVLYKLLLHIVTPWQILKPADLKLTITTLKKIKMKKREQN